MCYCTEHRLIVVPDGFVDENSEQSSSKSEYEYDIDAESDEGEVFNENNSDREVELSVIEIRSNE